MSDSVWPHRRQPTRLLCPWDSPGKNTGVGCHFLLQCMKVKSQSEVAQSCPTLSGPMCYSLPGSSIHGIFQARVLEWGAIFQSYGSPKTKILLNYLFFSLIYFNWKLINLQYCGGFCHTLTWISHGCTCIPLSWDPSHFLPHPIPLGCPSALALSALFHASSLDWSSVSRVVIYMFQCYSLTSSHPRLLWQSPKVCSLHVSFLLSCTYGCHYHLFKFHIYALICCIGVFLSDLLHCV